MYEIISIASSEIQAFALSKTGTIEDKVIVGPTIVMNRMLLGIRIYVIFLTSTFATVFHKTRPD